MKFKIKETKEQLKQEDEEVTLRLEKMPSGSIGLIASVPDGYRKNLLRFDEDGTVERYALADIGNFKFSRRGKIAIK